MPRGRIAPTPTGLLHAGHAQTFATAAQNASSDGLVMRIEDLDGPRCRPAFVKAAIDDLHWLGIEWTEGPDIGGPHSPYCQSQRIDWYLEIWKRLEAAGVIYPSPHSRKDVADAAVAPHGEGEIFPLSLRPPSWDRAHAPGTVPWRFKVPDGQTITFEDARCGTITRTAGVDFGDFVIWRRDDLPSYELAVVADDYAMEIQEVVRGEDLLTSTARLLLIYEALHWQPPTWCHTPLVCNAQGHRLAKRADGLSIRELRQVGMSPDQVLAIRQIP